MLMTHSRSKPGNSRSKLATSLAVAGALLVVGVALVVYGVVSRRPVPVALAPTVHATAAATQAVSPADTAAQGAAAQAVPAKAAATPAAGTPVALSADDFRYRGKWQVVSNMHDGRYAGMSARSFVPGARVIIRFRGHGIRLYGVDGPGGGTGTVALDGTVLDSGVDFRAPFKRTHTLVFASGVIPQGAHRLWVTVNAPSAGPRHHGFVNVESAAYDP